TRSENEGPLLDTDNPVNFDADMTRRNKNRKSLEAGLTINNKSEHDRAKERELEHHLHLPMPTMSWTDTPLKQVISDLRATNNINIVLDEAALNEAGISPTRPVTLEGVEGIMLKSALNLLLSQV